MPNPEPASSPNVGVVAFVLTVLGVVWLPFVFVGGLLGAIAFAWRPSRSSRWAALFAVVCCAAVVVVVVLGRPASHTLDVKVRRLPPSGAAAP